MESILLLGSAVSALKTHCLATHKTASSVRMRAVGMIAGSLIGDAASMGLHWIYNQEEIKDLVEMNPKQVAFFVPPSCPFYSYESGSLSPYGDEILPFLESFAEHREFRFDAAAKKSYEYFKAYNGRLNHVSSQFVANRDAGKPWRDCANVDHQGQGIVKAPLIVARYAMHDDLSEKLEEAVHVLQLSDLSVSCSVLLGRILERVLTSLDSPADAIRWVGTDAIQLSKMNEEMRQMIEFLLNEDKVNSWIRYTTLLARVPNPEEQPYKRGRMQAKLFVQVIKYGSIEAALESPEVSNESSNVDYYRSAFQYESDIPLPSGGFSIQAVLSGFGTSCLLPGALLGSLYVALHTRSFVEALRENILAGGDNCARSCVLGGLFGATADVYIPDSYFNAMKPGLLPQIAELALKVAASNSRLLS